MHLSHIAGPRDVPLIDATTGDELARIAERFADRDALVVRHQSYRATYGELWEQVDRAARALVARGIQKGDRVGIGAPNRYEWAIVQHAAARIGAILVTINPALREDSEATAAAIGADGWMHTGDLAVMDDDGDLGIVGRLTDMIIRGGENVYPREIEEVLHALPGARELAAVA